ncbi:hypothetical protein BT96DRAFT_984043 [Gymnopus androsaceus JB14]|uniref:Uncharacterized protein n=1 Tax=Gymnopus androsaceus JB14 TaxID=1447944 RepID=A0A6A4IQQ5_9AGAR|nr:hypothetical protein BT96DRAFT_984043 [Gymnopus androsaceus JB14]
MLLHHLAKVINSRSETEDTTDSEAAAESSDGDSMSDVTLVDSTISSLSTISDGEDSSAMYYHQPKPCLASMHGTPAAIANALPPSKYLRTSSCSEIPTPAPIAHPEVPLPESLNELLIQHNELSSVHLRLAHLLLASHVRAATAAAEIAQRETILEVRGRRRAWLNGALKVPENSVEPTKAHTWSGAMSSPFRPSGLGKYSFSSEEWECDPFHYIDAPRPSPLSTLVTDVYPNPFDSETDTSYSAYVFSHRRKRSASDTTISLFPVSEEDSLDGSDDEDSILHETGPAPRQHLDVEIDEDEEDDDTDGDDTDVDPLVDIELDDSDVLRKPSRPFLQIDTFSSATVLESPSSTSPTSLSMRLDVKIPKDPFDAPEDLGASPACWPLPIFQSASSISMQSQPSVVSRTDG